jgi:predicted amino acid racemase
MTSDDKMEILGSSSDHIILDSQANPLKVGDQVNFSLDYGGLLSAMTSPFIRKRFIDRNDHLEMEH